MRRRPGAPRPAAPSETPSRSNRSAPAARITASSVSSSRLHRVRPVGPRRTARSPACRSAAACGPVPAPRRSRARPAPPSSARGGVSQPGAYTSNGPHAGNARTRSRVPSRSLVVAIRCSTRSLRTGRRPGRRRSRSIRPAAGTRGSPGIVITSPQTMTTKPAPAESRTSRTLTRVPGRRTDQRDVGRERVLRLGHAHRQVPVTVGLDPLHTPLAPWSPRSPPRPHTAAAQRSPSSRAATSPRDR